MSTVPEEPGLEPTASMARPPEPGAPADGVPARVGEFEIVSRLGAGAFGQVFLARQGSLGRNVALKVMRGAGGAESEGHLLAGLEHDHIVKVYSAFADAESDTHGLCLQYVPGADLGVVIRRTHAGGAAPASGLALLAALDAVSRGESGFDPGALRDREALARDDFWQAVCRLGGRLAEALAYAHSRGVLHCDIKPANILLTPYGRPLLADFNVAFDRTRRRADGAPYGGTLAYMAPEYRAATLGHPGGRADERCDVYSLGVVLYELATGTRPHLRLGTPSAETVVPAPGGTGGAASDGALDPHPAPDDALAWVPRELAAVVRRCIDPNPAYRYQTAGDLAAALAGAWHLLAARRALPPPGRAGRWAVRRPVLALALAAVVPHLVASAAQISYNAVEVRLDARQERAFVWTVLGYNAVAYPVCCGPAVVLLLAIARRLPRLAATPGPAVDDLRRRVRLFAGRVAALGALGWFPGALAFPLAIDLAAGPLPPAVYGHFAVSFAMGGVIGMVFSYLTLQYVVFRALLPRLGNPDTHTPARMWAEVRPLTAAFGLLVSLACAVPLVGAVMLLTLDRDTMTLGFRLLVVKLIGLGVAGVAVADRVVNATRRLAAVWQTGGDAPP
jgi:serine/threonine protein kinase